MRISNAELTSISYNLLSIFLKIDLSLFLPKLNFCWNNTYWEFNISFNITFKKSYILVNQSATYNSKQHNNHLIRRLDDQHWTITINDILHGQITITLKIYNPDYKSVLQCTQNCLQSEYCFVNIAKNEQEEIQLKKSVYKIESLEIPKHN